MCSFLSSHDDEKTRNTLSFSARALAYSEALTSPARSSVDKVYEVVLKQAALVNRRGADVAAERADVGAADWDLLNEAYERCGEVCAEYAKTFYLGTASFVFTLFINPSSTS